MKLTIGLFCVMLMISSSFSLPAGNPNDDAEIINTSKITKNTQPQDDVDTDTTFKDFDGVIDTRAGDPYFSYSINPFSFLDYFQDTLRRIRDGIERKIWTQVGLGEDGDIDESKKNSTSVVKVIDGHKIEINETVYSNNDDDGHALYKVRIIQVRPLDLIDDDLTTDDGATYISDDADSISKTDDDNEVITDLREPIDKEINSSEIFYLHNHITSELSIDSTTLSPNQNFAQNDDDIDEIVLGDNFNNKNSKNESNFYTIINTNEKNQNLQNQVISNDNENVEELITTTTNQPEISDDDVNIEDDFSAITESPNEDENIEEIPTVTIEQQIPNNNDDENIEDLSTTTENLNKLYGNKRESLENDDENDSSEEEQKNENLESNEWETLEDNDSDIEKFEPIEIDLSNDIYVNDILADQGIESDPDAEIFSDVVINYQSNSNNNNTKIAQAINIDDGPVLVKQDTVK